MWSKSECGGGADIEHRLGSIIAHWTTEPLDFSIEVLISFMIAPRRRGHPGLISIKSLSVDKEMLFDDSLIGTKANDDSSFISRRLDGLHKEQFSVCEVSFSSTIDKFEALLILPDCLLSGKTQYNFPVRSFGSLQEFLLAFNWMLDTLWFSVQVNYMTIE